MPARYRGSREARADDQHVEMLDAHRPQFPSRTDRRHHVPGDRRAAAGRR